MIMNAKSFTMWNESCKMLMMATNNKDRWMPMKTATMTREQLHQWPKNATMAKEWLY